MYHEFFGLDEAPFKITPNLDLFYAGGRRGAVLDALLYAIANGEGIVKVVGEVGSGKTMLCRMLENQLSANVETIYIANPSLTRDEILYAVAEDMGISLDQRNTLIIRALQNRLIEKYAEGKQVVVFIDEAQAMPLESLEEVRLLSNLETGNHKLLQIVLFGQPELDEHLSQPSIRQLRERITHSFYLAPFVRHDIPDYLMFRMRAVGYRGSDPFSPGAVRLIERASQGLVRRINILADKALLAAFAESTQTVKPEHVQAAIRDSGLKLPFSARRAFIGAGIALAAALALWGGYAALNALGAKSPTPTGSAQAAAPVAPHPSPSAAAPALSPLEQRLAATREWLEKSDGQTATLLLQVTPEGAPADMEKRLADLERQLGADTLHVYRTVASGKPALGIAYGDYPSLGTARQAIAKLPGHLRANRPLPRSVDGIRTELGKANSTPGKG